MADDQRDVRAVLDANVLVRFFLTPRGGNARLLAAIDTGAFVLVTSESLLHEVADVLGRPHIQRYGPFPPEMIAEAVDSLRERAMVVPDHEEDVPGLADPKDRHVIGCAIDGKAGYLVTDDRKHLLPLGAHKGVRIVSPPIFLRSVLRETP